MNEKLYIVIVTSKKPITAKNVTVIDFEINPGDVIGQEISEEELEKNGQNLIDGFKSCLKYAREFFGMSDQANN